MRSEDLVEFDVRGELLHLTARKSEPLVVDMRQVRWPSGPQAIDHDELVEVVPLQKAVDEVRSNKSRAPCQQQFLHVGSRSESNG